jgi:hypothetical protein
MDIAAGAHDPGCLSGPFRFLFSVFNTVVALASFNMIRKNVFFCDDKNKNVRFLSKELSQRLG